MFSTSAISLLTTVAGIEVLKSSRFLSASPIFYPNFGFHWFVWIHQEFYFLNYLIFYFVCITSSFSQLLFWLNYFFFKSTGTVFNLSASKSSSFVFKFFKPVETLTNLLISILSTLAIKAMKSLWAAKLDVSTPAASYRSF